MPPTLRFRPVHGNPDKPPPRTPRSPRGAYTGELLPNHTQLRRKPKCLAYLLIILVLFVGSLCIYPQRGRSANFGLWLPDLPFTCALKPPPSQSYIPLFPVYNTSFQDNTVFKSKGKEADRAWRRMIPRGGGRIIVKNSKNFGLPPSALAVDQRKEEIPDTEIYIVSAVRQIVCLVSCQTGGFDSKLITADSI